MTGRHGEPPGRPGQRGGGAWLRLWPLALLLAGGILAYALGLGFIPVRKPGKLPRSVLEQSYQLEYGEDCLQMHCDAIKPGDKVLVVDDLLATGGTVEATIKMIREAGGVVEHAAFVISLPDLGGEERLTAMGVKVLKLVDFPGH